MSLREEEAAFASDWFCVRLLVGRRARLLDAADPGGPPLRLARPLKVIAYGKWGGPWWALLAGRLYRIEGPGCKRLRVLGRPTRHRQRNQCKSHHQNHHPIPMLIPSTAGTTRLLFLLKT